MASKEPSDSYLDRSKYPLTDQVVVITGASAGVGKETARDLALRGATIVMGNRDLDKSGRVIAALREEEGADKLPEDRFVVKKLDLSDLASVKSFAEQVKKEYPIIDILVNNAGKMGGERVVTKDGYESQFQTNHLSHFLLTHLLIDNLLQSKNKPKVLNLSSRAHMQGKANFLDDLQCERSYPNQGFGAYSNSKLMNVLFTKSLAEKFDGRLNSYAIHPGVVKTELGRSSAIAGFFYSCVGFLMKTERQGAYTSIYCATSPQAATESGLYYADSKPTNPSKISRDPVLAQKLWEKSCELLQIQWQ